MSMMDSDLAQQIAMAAAIATIKAFRDEDPEEVARLCREIDDRCGMPHGSWGVMLAALVHDRNVRLVSPYRKRRRPGPVDLKGYAPPTVVNAIADQDQRGLRVVKPAEPDPNLPFWQR